MLKDEGFKDRKELSDKMYDLMKKFGGIGLSANQVGLPFNMFVLGGHLQIENGLKFALATGNFGVKNSFNKQGISQLYNKMSFNSVN